MSNWEEKEESAPMSRLRQYLAASLWNRSLFFIKVFLIFGVPASLASRRSSCTLPSIVCVRILVVINEMIRASHSFFLSGADFSTMFGVFDLLAYFEFTINKISPDMIH